MRLRPDGYLEADTFEEHMHPDVQWIDDPDYAAAFAELVGGPYGGTMTNNPLPDEFPEPRKTYPNYLWGRLVTWQVRPFFFFRIELSRAQFCINTEIGFHCSLTIFPR